MVTSGMTPWSTVLAVLVEDQGSVPKAHVVQCKTVSNT